MSLTRCKDCGGSVSKSAKACPHCGAPVKRRGVISSLARLFIIVFLIIPLGIAIFLAVYDSRTKESPPAATEIATQPRGQPATSCSLSDISIKSMKVRFVDECRASPCIYLKGVAVLTNACSVPIGVQIKIIGYDKSGSPMATRELWPASTSNISPGDYTFSLDQWLDYQPGMESVELIPVRVRQWR